MSHSVSHKYRCRSDQLESILLLRIVERGVPVPVLLVGVRLRLCSSGFGGPLYEELEAAGVAVEGRLTTRGVADLVLLVRVRPSRQQHPDRPAVGTRTAGPQPASKSSFHIGEHSYF